MNDPDLRDDAIADLCAQLFRDGGRLQDTIDHPVRGRFKIRPHRHRQLLQLDLIEGCGGRVTLDGEDRSISGVTALAHPPGAWHGYELTRGNAESHVYHLKLAVEWNGSAGIGRALPRIVTGLPEMGPLARAVRAVCRGASLRSKRPPLLLARLAEALALWPGEGPAAIHAQAVDEQRDLDLAIRLIEGRLDDPPSVSELAAAAHLSPRHFARRFRQRFGCTPLNFLTARRLDRAKTLLLDQRLHVGGVGEALGFSSTATFSRWFHQHAGTSASRFRRDPETV